MTIRLARHPELWDRLCEDAAKAATLPHTHQDMLAYPFAEALFRETVRFYPATFFTSRQVVQPIQLSDFRISTGTIVLVPIGLLGYDPELYPNPNHFDPARWLNRKEPLTPMELSQFGGGPHFCIGYHLAWLEAVQFALTLARVMSQAGLRPRLADGPMPKQYYLPLGHPTPTTRIDFV